ncbi:unnamed protein product [Prunus armeniaca]|uniref:Uncharacterized protein n=1 Tax=Prunus armeniaca TaxID=36596 RepID=A0A6J5XDD9_PRUAR|nr:unnamed protein product [Prunus armeniaca]
MSSANALVSAEEDNPNSLRGSRPGGGRRGWKPGGGGLREREKMRRRLRGGSVFSLKSGKKIIKKKGPDPPRPPRPI